jgi:cytochrome c oxidase cbb3-type subunit 3
MSAFWHWFVIVITVGSLAAYLWLLFANARRKPDEGDDTGHVWDDDLRELNQPLPRWWLNLFVLTIVFAVGYLALYPGLGNYAGRLGWTQQGQVQARLDAVHAQRAQLYAQFEGRDFTALATDAAAKSLGRELFLNNCAGCHGADARGAVGFPDLADADWLYGGSPEAIVASITGGRRGVMPAFNGALQPDAVLALAQFLPRWSDPELDPGTRADALKQFASTCAACHGADGRGNHALGAPNLTDAVWLFGGTPARVRESILFGRSGGMPAHAERLSAEDIRLVGAYVYGLSQPSP